MASGTLTDNGDTSVVSLNPHSRVKVALVAGGSTWDSGSLQLKAKVAGSADQWVNLGSPITAAGEIQDEIQGFDQIKGTMSSVAAAGADVDYSINVDGQVTVTKSDS